MAEPASLAGAEREEDAPEVRQPEVIRAPMHALAPYRPYRPPHWSIRSDSSVQAFRREIEENIVEFARAERDLICRGKRIKDWEKVALLTALHDIFGSSPRESRQAQERYLKIRREVLLRIKSQQDQKLAALAAKNPPVQANGNLPATVIAGLM